jgi:hypothetical protein
MLPLVLLIATVLSILFALGLAAVSVYAADQDDFNNRE